MAFVPAAMSVPGLGSKVSSWLGPPPIHSTTTDFAGRRSLSAAGASAVPSGVSHANEAAPAARNWRRWKCGNGSTVSPGGGRVQRAEHTGRDYPARARRVSALRLAAARLLRARGLLRHGLRGRLL